MLEVRYDITAEDFVAFNVRLARRTGPSPVVWVLYVFFVAWFAFLTFQAAENGNPGLAALAAVIGLLFAVYIPISHRLGAGRAVRRYLARVGDQGIVGPVTLTLTDDGLTEVTAAARSEVAWGKMVDFTETPDHLFIRITTVSGCIIPRRAFDRPEDYAAVRDFVRARVRET